jgi:hypothetical protein
MIGEVANAPDPVNPIQMARPERFELPTTWFEAKCSIQLSYGRVGLEYIQLAVIVHGEITRPLRGLAEIIDSGPRRQLAGAQRAYWP